MTLLEQRDMKNFRLQRNSKMTVILKLQTSLFKVFHQIVFHCDHHKFPKKYGTELSFLCKAQNCHYKKRNVNCMTSFDKFSICRRVLNNVSELFGDSAQLINNLNVMKVNETSPSEYKVSEQSTTRMEQVYDGRLVVPVFNQGDDPIACLNKAMAFLIVVVSLVQGRQGQSYAGTGYKGNATSSGGNNVGGQTRVVKCYNCQGEGHMARQCTQPKRPRNTAWFKEKAMLAEAQESIKF
ncbi:retrovirus-related pol polyprotein from transposon TNT 1-94 [Tanacetum coccineum]|uniref:Retrovirus-related pol polyprotein from transposon TNT 1-94 n=1 Tax=Tanacetum coccineum TaxID=301880 RepID=A0ABQ4ZKU0_9ASTR